MKQTDRAEIEAIEARAREERNRYNREWRENNREHMREYNRKYSAEHSEKIKENKRKWAKKNRARLNA